MTEILDAAMAAHRAGLSVLPPEEDGSKAPAGPKWKRFQVTRATEGEVQAWYRNGRTGLGVVCGAVSGGLEMLEFEGRAVAAGLNDEFIQMADAAGLAEVLDRIVAGYMEKTPSGGIHLLYRCAEVGDSQKIARRPATPEELAEKPAERIKVLLETKAEGGYVIVAPSGGRVHPSGGAWELEQGGFDSIAVITPEERSALLRLARTLDQMPKPKARETRAERTSSGVSKWEVTPGDDYSARTTWAEILEPLGWRRLFNTQGGNEHWCRPGKERGTSATISEDGEGALYVFTTSSAFDEGTAYTRFGAYTVLNHAGDYKMAARALEEEGYGKLREAEDDQHGRQDLHQHGVQDPDDDQAELESAMAALAAMEGERPVEPGWAVLDAVVSFLCRYVIFPSRSAAYAVALWAVHTHAIEAFETTPRLGLMSAEKRSGKSRALEVLELLVARPAMAATMSAAVVFRKVDAEHPTLLLDETDTIFSKGRDDRNEDLRGLLNAGQRRGVPAYRCTGPKMETVKAYDAFAAVALAGIGELPSTIADRSVLIPMKRRAPHEVVERFRRRKVVPKATAVRKRMETWCKAQIPVLTAAEPALPEELDDRAADGWEPLLAIADAAGGEWPKRARTAAIELSAGRTAEDDTMGVRLLADVATVFTNVDRLSSADLAARLAGLEEAPWAVWKKGDPRAPIDARTLARMLKPYGIKPKQVWFGEPTGNLRGYERSDFADAWARYCPPVTGNAKRPLEPLESRSEPISEPLEASEQLPLESASDLRSSGLADKTAPMGVSPIPTKGTT